MKKLPEQFSLCITTVLIIIYIILFIIFVNSEDKRINNIQDQLIKEKIKNTLLENKINKLKNDLIKNNYYENVTVTAYNPFPSQTNNDPDKTAIMETPVPGWTCAVSRDLIHLINKKIYIENVGVFRVNDLMNKRYINRIDICMGKKKDAIEFGKMVCNIVVLTNE